MYYARTTCQDNPDVLFIPLQSTPSDTHSESCVVKEEENARLRRECADLVEERATLQQEVSVSFNCVFWSCVTYGVYECAWWNLIYDVLPVRYCKDKCGKVFNTKVYVSYTWDFLGAILKWVQQLFLLWTVFSYLLCYLFISIIRKWIPTVYNYSNFKFTFILGEHL